MVYYGTYYDPNELYHYGVKGMRWGVRRYQNRDGSLTSAGQRRREGGESGSYSRNSSGRGSNKSSKANKSKRLKRALGVTAAAAAAAGLAYAGRKKYLNQFRSYEIPRLNGTSYALKNRTAADKLRSAVSGLKGKYNDAKTRRNTPRLADYRPVVRKKRFSERVSDAYGSVRDKYNTYKTRKNTPRLADYRPVVRKKRLRERATDAANRLRSNKAYRKYAYRRANRGPIDVSYVVR